MLQVLQTDLENVSSISISPSGKMVGILSNNDINIYNLQSGKLQFYFSHKTEYLNKSQNT